MANPTNYGRLWGQIPSTAGQVFWVAPADSYTVNGQATAASDDNNGLDPQQALRTIDRAWNLVTANAGDVIVLLPGTHSPAAAIEADVAGVTMMGLPSGAGNYFRQKTTIDAVASDNNLEVSAADIEIAHLHFVPTTAQTALLFTNADRMHVHDCSFDLATPAANTSTMGMEAGVGTDHALIQRCYFECDGAQGAAISAGPTTDSMIENCVFSQTAGTWAAAISQGLSGRRLMIRGCLFHVGNGTMTVGILGVTGGEVSMVQINHCIFADSVATPIDDYDAGDAEIAECYQSGLGSTDGGVLITATT